MPDDLNYILFADLIKKISSDSGSMDEINTALLKTILSLITGGGGSVDLQNTTTDIEITDPTKGLILRTDDGTRVLITVVKDVNGDIRLNPVII